MIAFGSCIKYIRKVNMLKMGGGSRAGGSQANHTGHLYVPGYLLATLQQFCFYHSHSVGTPAMLKGHVT